MEQGGQGGGLRTVPPVSVGEFPGNQVASEFRSGQGIEEAQALLQCLLPGQDPGKCDQLPSERDESLADPTGQLLTEVEKRMNAAMSKDWSARSRRSRANAGVGPSPFTTLVQKVVKFVHVNPLS